MKKVILFCTKAYYWYQDFRKQSAFEKYIRYPAEKKCYLIGTPVHNNIGDGAIVLAELEFLKKVGIREKSIKEITVPEFYDYHKQIKKCVHPNASVFFHGGGNMGDQWIEEEMFRRERIMDFESNPMVIFPQTIYYSDSEKGRKEQEASVPFYNNRKELVIVAREEKSDAMMRKLYPDTEILLTPDIVLSTQASTYGVVNRERHGITFCMRNDPERAMTDEMIEEIKSHVRAAQYHIHETDMMSDVPVSKFNRWETVRNKMQEFADSQLVITDRLHGMVFSAITGTPCIVFGNYNHKVRGTYAWIEYLPYIHFVESADDVKKILPDLLAMGNCVFDNKPLLPHFEKLAEVVRKYASD